MQNANELDRREPSSTRRGLARRPVVWAIAVAAGALFAAGVWPKSLPADAETRQVADLQALCETDHAHHRRAQAIDELAAIDSSTSRKALEALAASSDERLAVQAMSAIGRADYSGAKTFLKKVLADTKRSAPMRGAALSAYCLAEHKGGAKWADIKSNCASSDSKDTAIDDVRDAVKAKLWGKE